MEKKTRVSRYDTSSPIVRRNRIVRTTPTEREDRELFPLLDRQLARDPWTYTLLPRDYLAAFLPDWGQAYIRKRLPVLAHEPNNYLHQPEMQTANKFKLGRYLIYSHPDTPLNEDEFWHDLMANMIAAQIELGVVRDPDLQLVNFRRILNSPQMPKNGATDWTIEIPPDDKKLRPKYVRPDWQIFAIGKEDGSAFRFYCGIEADKGTEPLRRNHNPRKSIQSMIRRMLDIDRLKLARKLYGLPELYFPIVCNKQARAEAFIDLIKEETEGKGHPRIIVNTFPVYNSYQTPLPPDGTWFCSTWKRAAGKNATWTTEYRMDQL